VKLAQTVKDLESADLQRRRSAIDWLAQVPAAGVAKTDAIRRALEQALDDNDEGLRVSAIRAPGNRGSKDSGAAIPRMPEPTRGRGAFLNEPQKAALEALTKLRDPRGAAAAALYLDMPFGNAEAEKCLRAIGRAAEPEVAKHFHSPDFGTRERA